ncbi:Soluble epoxide hydrolase [Aquisphaera giovannonii]|uniref:Soluble epoxide hydrolase n=1 Tax=Aquisphaera giovannonii TaxID=406548 RepID=A0A5B9VVG8_9BACT|nr:alpha/beta hydrolase [Aquisphaera giovannonii]QEH32228.1 Soluble epoxide hydrolase [Aquisphaera giovannonii]
MDAPLSHGIAQLSSDVRIHYGLGGEGEATALLIHGYPQNGWQWRHVVGPLAAAGFRVVVPDYRGAGRSSKPTAGYDKRTMAADLRALVREHLKIEGPLAVVGHDIGSMVAFAFALQFPDDVSHLSLCEAPLPGTRTYDEVVGKTRLAGDPLWHFSFHNAGDNLAEALTFGRERAYIDSFYDRLAFNPGAISLEDRARYAEAFASAGAMRAGFEVFRAFDKDAEDNRAALEARGRLRMPVLSLGGAHSVLAPGADEPMMKEVAEHATVRAIPAAGHWIAEENPEAVAEALVGFLRA